MKRSEESDAVAKANHKHGNSFANLLYARVSKLFIHITMHQRKAPINPAVKNTKHNKMLVTNIKRRPVDFSNSTKWVFTLCSFRNNLASLGSLTKI